MFRDKYGLPDIPVKESKEFSPVTPEEHRRIKRSAHNYNDRTEMQFMTRYKNGVLCVTRIA